MQMQRGTGQQRNGTAARHETPPQPRDREEGGDKLSDCVSCGCWGTTDPEYDPILLTFEQQIHMYTLHL